MSFGKRAVPAHLQPRPAAKPSPPVPLTKPDFTERVGLLLADMTRVLAEATAMAKLIRGGERLNTAAYHGSLTTETFPIVISGFDRHFNFQRDGKLKHSVYCYLLPGDVLDRKAQLHLLEMTTAIHSFNTLCVAGHDDDALPIALQSHTARDSVDKTIVISAFFCATLQNLLYQQAILTGSPAEKKRGPDAARMKKNLADWSIKAKQVMIAKDRYDYHFPDVVAPVGMAEPEIAEHLGQLVVNHVYLPVELAQPVMTRMAAAQGRR